MVAFKELRSLWKDIMDHGHGQYWITAMTNVSKICLCVSFSGHISLGTHLWKHSVPAAGRDETQWDTYFSSSKSMPWNHAYHPFEVCGSPTTDPHHKATLVLCVWLVLAPSSSGIWISAFSPLFSFYHFFGEGQVRVLLPRKNIIESFCFLGRSLGYVSVLFTLSPL